VTAAVHEPVRARLRRWWLARLPRTDSWTLTQNNIYILPTHTKLMFTLTLILMLLASINYQLNLGFALTFLLAGAGLVSMHLTHATLRGLTLHLRPPQPVFAGDVAALDVVLINPGGRRGKWRHGVSLHVQEAGRRQGQVWTDVPAEGQASARLAIVPPTRGPHELPTLVAETLFPFGLFRAWTLWRPAASLLVWPRPETPAPPLPGGTPRPDDHRPQTLRRSGAELDGVRAWRRGDSLRQVLWKKVARSGELVSRDTAGASAHELVLDWQTLPLRDPEQRLSRLAAWVLAAEDAGLPYRLALPGHALPRGHGQAQRRAALDALASWGRAA
jgi:uncharacterized protein (DUF58 family)